MPPNPHQMIIVPDSYWLQLEQASAYCWCRDGRYPSFYSRPLQPARIDKTQKQFANTLPDPVTPCQKICGHFPLVP